MDQSPETVDLPALAEALASFHPLLTRDGREYFMVQVGAPQMQAIIDALRKAGGERSQERLPDLPDMQKAGMGLTEALAFWNEIQNTPGHEPTYWWRVMADRVKPSDQENGRQMLQ